MNMHAPAADPELGGTFIVAVVAVFLGIGQVVLACIFGSGFSDVPSLTCCHGPIPSNRYPNMAVSGGV